MGIGNKIIGYMRECQHRNWQIIKIVKLTDEIDALINSTHKMYMSTSDDDIEKKAFLDGKIKAYWQIKDKVENLLLSL